MRHHRSQLPARLVVLLLLTAAVAGASPSAAPAGAVPTNTGLATATAASAAPQATCHLYIEGHSYGKLYRYTTLPVGVKHATVNCTGGRVAIAVNEALLGKHKQQFKGVTWDKHCPTTGCMLSICGDTHVVLADSVIKGVAVALASTQKLSVQDAHFALCIRNTSQVELRRSSIFWNNVSAVLARDNTSLTLRASSIEGNVASFFAAGMMATGRAHVIVDDGIIVENERQDFYEFLNKLTSESAVSSLKVWSEIAGVTRNIDLDNSMMIRFGGAVGVFSDARLEILGDSSVSSNKCTDCLGAGIGLGEFASLVVSGGRISGNILSNILRGETLGALGLAGGGIMAAGNTTVAIGNNSRIAGNSASFGAGLAFDGSAQANITGPVVILGQESNFPVLDTAFDTAQDTGPGLYARGTASVNISGAVRFEHNRCAVSSQRRPATCGVVKVSQRAVVRIADGAYLGGVEVSDRWGDDQQTLDTLHVADSARLLIGSNVLFQGRLLQKCSSNVFLRRTSCNAGEFRAAGNCQCCPPNTYGFETNATCMACPSNAVCPGGDQVWPQAGYWHSSPKSVQMHKCPLDTMSCGDQGVCTTAYTGTLCGACAPGYGVTLPLRCGKCLSATRQLLLYLALFCLCVALISYTVHVTWVDNSAGGNDLRPSDLLKVLVQFLQYLVIFGSLSVPFPSFLTSTFTAAAVVFSGAAGQSSLDCLLQRLYAGGVGSSPLLAVQRQLIAMLLAPVAVLVAVMLVLCAAHVVKVLWQRCSCAKWRQQHTRARSRIPAFLLELQLWSRLRVAVLVVAFFAYPTMVKAALSFFACLPVDVAGKQPFPQYAVKNHSAGYWVGDIQQECYAGWHRAWALGLGLPATLVLCVGVPVVLVLFLLRNSDKSDDEAFREHYGFLYRNYTASRLWWEAVWAVQTVLLTAVSVFHFSLKAYYSLLTMGMILLLSGVVQQVARPYIQTWLHRLHLGSICTLFLNTWLALYLYTFEADQSDVDPAHTAVGALMVALNVVFVAWCVFSIVQLSLPRLRRAAGTAVTWIRQHLPARCGGKASG